MILDKNGFFQYRKLFGKTSQQRIAEDKEKMSFDMKKVGWTACKNKDCKYGLRCTFRHGGETREDVLTRLSNKTKAVKAEDKLYTWVCGNWEEHGVCPYGNRCHFAHCKETDLSVWRLWKHYKNEVEQANKFSSPEEAADFETNVQNMAANFDGDNSYYIRFIGPKTAEEIGEIIYHSGGYSSSDIVVDNDNGVAFCYTEVMGKEGMPDKFVAEKDGVKLLMTRWVNKATKAKHELKEFVEAEEADDVDEIAHAVLAEAAGEGEVPEEDLTDEEEEALDKALGFTEEEFDGDTEFALKVLAGMDPEQSEVLMTAIQTIATEFAAAVEVA